VAYTLKEQDNWFPDLEEIERNLKAVKTGSSAGSATFGRSLMFVNYPHMPTGQLPTREMFTDLVGFALKYNILICHDNPYSFILNKTPMSLLSIEGAKDVVIELNSLSKSHNMAGWRVGMLCGLKERIDEVLRFKSNMDSGMFLPVQLAAAKALQLNQEWYDELNCVYTARRKKVFELLQKLDCCFSEKQAGMFVWASVPPVYTDGYDLSAAILKESNVFVTPGGIFGNAGNQYVRASLCTTEEKITEAIRRIRD
jgi:aspartate/methionine/tyrosine aminotransferase